MSLNHKKLFLFDIDGVLITGTLEHETRVLGGYRLFATLKRNEIPFGLLGSGSHQSTFEAWSLFRSLGFMVQRDQVWLAARVAAEYLKEKMGRVKCLVVGEEGLRRELKSHGHKIVDGWREAEAVVVGLDRFLTFKKLTEALRAINNKKVPFIAVNKVRWYYSPNQGPLMSPGALVHALEYMTGENAVVVGKPSLIHFQTVLCFFKVKPEDAVMVGDTYESDLKPARTQGMTTVLVSNIKRWERQQSVEADYNVGNVDELVSHL
ncbi:MAG: HAD-IIA family hydrolase [Candidatus Caldarchaeum sp.]